MSNIEILINYLKNTEKRSLIINQVNEEIGSFYLCVLRYISKDLNLKISLEPEIEKIGHVANLFDLEEVDIFQMPNLKNFEKIINIDSKNIILTDYKNFKKYQNRFKNIDGYNYESDIKYFFKSILNIKNNNLIASCISNPQLTYSEYSKYLLNEIGYVKDISIAKEINFILDVRKSIFKYKQSSDIKKIFFKIKEETQYKKFSFLTF